MAKFGRDLTSGLEYGLGWDRHPRIVEFSKFAFFACLDRKSPGCSKKRKGNRVNIISLHPTVIVGGTSDSNPKKNRKRCAILKNLRIYISFPVVSMAEKTFG